MVEKGWILARAAAAHVLRARQGQRHRGQVGAPVAQRLFIGLLAFADDPLLQAEVKIGNLLRSGMEGLLGWAGLRVTPRDVLAPGSGAPTE